MFSVIIPVYNGEKFIENAIGSVMSQTFDKWELIVVDDGSTDGTKKILEKYADNPKIKVITKENGGVSDARNVAMENASYDYFAFLDCDDMWFADHLETLYTMIEQYPDAGTYATLACIRYAHGGTSTNIGYFEDRGDTEDVIYIQDFMAEYDRDKRAKIHFPTCSCVSRAAAQKAGQFRKGCKIGEDLAFFLLAAVYFPVVLSKKITTVYEKGNSTATKDVSFDPDWYFFDEVHTIFADDTVPAETKKSLENVMQWFTMRRCRHYIIDGRKGEAKKHLGEIGNNPRLKKGKALTYLLFILPTRLVRKIFMIRWRFQG